MRGLIAKLPRRVYQVSTYPSTYRRQGCGAGCCRGAASAGPNADFGGQMDPCHPVTIVTLSPCRWESHLRAAVGAPLAMGFPALHWAAARVGVPRRAAVPAPTLPSTS